MSHAHLPVVHTDKNKVHSLKNGKAVMLCPERTREENLQVNQKINLRNKNCNFFAFVFSIDNDGYSRIHEYKKVA